MKQRLRHGKLASRERRDEWGPVPVMPAGDAFERLLAGAAAGEGWAFTELYERYAQRVKAFAASRRVADPDAVANDVMLRVFHNVATFKGDEAGLTSWTFTIARNRIIDERRAASRRPEIVPEGEVESAAAAPEPARSAEESALERMSHDRALQLLDLLTEDQREVVALRMIADLSLEQVATIVDKPITAVKALQRRGLQRLQREILAEEVSR